MSWIDHLELGPNCPNEDTECKRCPERRKNGCTYATGGNMVEPDEREFAKYFKPIESHDPRADIFECTLELTICDEDMTTPTMQYLCSNMEQLREALNKADDALCDNYTVLAVIDTSGTHRTIMHS